MKTITRIAGSLLLVLHGLIHLMGTLVYLKLAEIDGLNYKTNLLNGLWEIGAGGMAVNGMLWAIAAVFFAAAGLLWMIRKSPPLKLILGAALFSLLLTGLDYSSAFAGIVINLLILAWLGLKMRMDRKQALG